MAEEHILVGLLPFKSDEATFKTTRYDVSHFCKFPLISHLLILYRGLLCQILVITLGKSRLMFIDQAMTSKVTVYMIQY